MKVLKNNKGFWAFKVDENNDKMMLEKNAYILSDNL